MASRRPVSVPPVTASVMLYWLPLGAGGHWVRWNGRVFEAVVSRLEHRAVQDLYHSALAIHVGKKSYVIEMTPVWVGEASDRGDVREGPVGCGGWIASGCSDMRFDGGAMVLFEMLPKRWWVWAREKSATTARAPALAGPRLEGACSGVGAG